MPKTWQDAPIYIDSPANDFSLQKNIVAIRMPLKEVGFPSDFNYHGVAVALIVDTNLHKPNKQGARSKEQGYSG